MKTFYFITQKIVCIRDYVFSFSDKQNKFTFDDKTPVFNNYKEDTIDPILKIFFHVLLSKEYTIKNKFSFFKDTNNNLFLNSQSKETFNRLFQQIQFVYSQFQKLSRLYKYKKTRINVNTDLSLNNIEEHNKNIICIFQDNGKYLFNILDLIKIIYNSLTHSVDFFSEPKPIKNPYNNLPFNKSNLYNIYFYIKFYTHYEINLFEKYFKINFNLSFFNEKYEFLLREYAIHNFINKSSRLILRNKINNMLCMFNLNNPRSKICIHSDFPNDILIKIMRPYLLLYITGIYSMVPTKKTYANIKLDLKLKQFFHFNPLFGRKNIILHKNFNPPIKQINFNDKHIFYSKENLNNDTFLLNHTTCDPIHDLTFYFQTTPEFLFIDTESVGSIPYESETDSIS